MEHAAVSQWMMSLQRDGRVVIGQRRGRLVILALFGGFIAALMGASYFKVVRDGHATFDVGPLAVAATAALMAWASLNLVMRLIRGGELRIDDTGLHCSVWPRFDVPWSALLDVRLYAPSNANAQVILDLDPAWTPSARQSGRLPGYPLNRFFIGRHAAYIAPVLRADAGDLADFLGQELARRSSALSFHERIFDRRGEAVVKVRAIRMLPAVVLGAAGSALGVTGLWSRWVKADFSERPVATSVAVTFVVVFTLLLRWALVRAMEAATVTVDHHGVRVTGRNPVELPWSALFGVRLETRGRYSRVVVLDLGGRSIELPRGMGLQAYGLAMLLDREILTRRFSGRPR